MAMVCPQCNEAYNQALQCPACGVRLLYQPAGRSSRSSAPGQGDQWQYTPWGRIVVGILIGQGVAHGLKMLLTAGWLAAGDDTTVNFWATVTGSVTWQSLQCFSLIVSAALVGAGQARGLFIGSLVGLVNGLIFLLIQHLSGEALAELTVYGQPALHLTCGAFGGLVGTIVWKPLPTLKLPDLRDDGTKKLRPSSYPTSVLFAGPVAWGRVLAGTFIVVCGIIWPKAVLNALVEFGQGKLFLASDFQAQLITWEITGLVTLIGAAVAGATTPNGLKQGLCVGVLASMVLIGHHLGSGTKVLLEHAIFMAFSIFMLNLAGGWFGAQLYPPVAARRRKLGSAVY